MDKVINGRKIESDEAPLSHEVCTWKEKNRKLGLDMKKILKPVLYGMALAGCYNFTNVRQSGTKIESKNLLKSAVSLCYRIIICAVICMSIVRAVVACFHVTKEYMTTYVQFVIWLLYNLVTFLIFIKSSSRKFGNIEKASYFWIEHIVPLFDQLSIPYPEIKLKRRATIAVILCIISVLINIVCAYLQVHMTNSELYFSPFEKNSFTFTVALAFFGVETFVWMMPVAMIVIFSMFIKEAFNATSQYIKSICEHGNLERSSNFEKVCLLHTNLCSLVQILDKDLGWYFATSIVFNIWSCSILLYQMMLNSLDDFYIILVTFWLLACVFNVTMSILHAALLHEMIGYLLISENYKNKSEKNDELCSHHSTETVNEPVLSEENIEV